MDEHDEEYEKLLALGRKHPTHRVDVTGKVRHAEFAKGVRDRSLVMLVVRDPLKMMSPFQYAFFIMAIGMYVVAPIVGVPMWARHEGNWWLLTGILAAVGLAPRLVELRRWYVAAVLAGGLWVLWAWLGIHNFWTFIALCAVWGYVTFAFCMEGRTQFVINSLVIHREMFREAITARRIIVLQRGGKREEAVKAAR